MLNKKLAGGKDRKYFDSGDYALCKAANSKNPEKGGENYVAAPVGVQHPDPESIPHNMNFSPLRKNSFSGSAGAAGSPQMYLPRRSSIVSTNVMNANDILTA